MATSGGPKIVTDGLVFGYDTGYPISDNDTATRFSPGKPAVNSVPDADTMASWSSYSNGNDGTFVTEFGTTGYKIINRASWNGLYKDITLPSTGVYTFSAWFRLQHSSTGNNGATVYISGYGSGDTATAIDRSKIGEWQRIEKTVTVTDVTLRYYLISYGGSGATSSWEVTMPQVELASERTPFVNGTRSSTQGLLDLAGTTNIDVSNVSFDSNAQMTFDGTDDILYANAENDYPYPLHSWEVWFKTNQVDSGGTAGLVGLDYGRVMYLVAANGGSIVYTLYSNMSSPNVLVLSISGGTNLLDNEWHQLVCSRGTSAAEIWVDGSLVKTASNGGQATWNGINQWSGMAARFGDNPNNVSLKFTGPIPIIKIYNKQLSEAEIKSNFNANKNRFGL